MDTQIQNCQSPELARLRAKEERILSRLRYRNLTETERRELVTTWNAMHDERRRLAARAVADGARRVRDASERVARSLTPASLGT